MGHEFDRDTEVSAVGENEYAADLGPGWVVGGGVNGGYLLAVIGNALRETLPGKPDPIAVTAYYLAASKPGPATIRTRVVRDGRRTSTVAADLSQGGTDCITVLATFGDLSTFTGDVRTTALEPELPPVEECIPTSMAPEEIRRIAPLMSRFDLRLDPAYAGWAVGEPSGNGVIQGWFRLNDERDPDPISLLLTVDALPPVTFDLGMPGWAPTLELSAHVRAIPAKGWLKVRHETRNLAGGMFEEDCVVWDSTGRLVAQARQLALAPRPQ
ncbi:TesB-like acyl-CoA thioesterase 3 [Nocardioides sp. Soil797]|nr:TesB-like acyl-CoA thioesterase 3 [Nocardioides sp. Soil797]